MVCQPVAGGRPRPPEQAVGEPAAAAPAAEPPSGGGATRGGHDAPEEGGGGAPNSSPADDRDEDLLCPPHKGGTMLLPGLPFRGGGTPTRRGHEEPESQDARNVAPGDVAAALLAEDSL